MPKPYHLVIDLEIVTPLLLGGADAKGEPELRPPAFRGALRYWLRAMLGGVVGDQNLMALRNLEAAVMGDTTTGSPIGLRLSGPPPQHAPAAILPHCPNSVTREAFSAGGTLKLYLDQVRSDDEAVWQAACAALGLALTFGGVGLRSRRGYGTLRVKQSNSSLVPVFPVDADSWETHTRQVLRSAVAAARGLAVGRRVPTVPLANHLAAYPAANLLGKVRLYQDTAASPMAAVTDFMRKAHAQPDPARGGISPRQASPLWVRPVQMGTCFGLLLVVLASRFGAADYRKVDVFLDTNFPAHRDITVRGWNA